MDDGQLALDTALAAVDDNADEKWKAAANWAVAHVARRRAELTADDVWDALEADGVATHDNRAMGPVMRRAAKDGLIQWTDRTTKTRRPSRNRGDVRVWRSLMFWEDQ